MATIEKRTNIKGVLKYRVRVRIRGCPKQSATFNNIRDAKLWALQTEAAINERRYFRTREASRMTIADLISRYERDILPYKSTSASFIRTQTNQLRWWKEQLGDYYIFDVGTSQIVEARAKLTVSAATKNRYIYALSHVFSIAVREWELLPLSPTRNVSKLKEPRGRVRFLSEEERSRLLAAAERCGNQPVHLAIVLALSTGARKGELLNLKWADVDFQRRRLTFHETKNGERRSVGLGAYAVGKLREYHSNQQNSPLVFPNQSGGILRIDREFRQLLRETDIADFRFHDLRHSAASYLAMNHATIADIAEVLGHKTLAMVKRYAHLSDTHTSKVIDRMNEAIFDEYVA